MRKAVDAWGWDIGFDKLEKMKKKLLNLPSVQPRVNFRL